jgi:hypothetical protein
MTVRTSAGCKLSVSNAVSDSVTKIEFEAETFVKVGEIENIGEFGSEFSAINFSNLEDRLQRKFKGVEDPGTLSLNLGLDPADTGQIQLQTALAVDDDYAIKVELNDGDTTPTTYYFRAQVMSFKRVIGGNSDVLKATCSLGINTRPLVVAAT